MAGEPLNFAGLLHARARGRGPADLVRQSEGRLSMSTVAAHWNGEFPSRGLTREVVEAYARVLPAGIDAIHEAIGRSIYGDAYDSEPPGRTRQALDSVVGLRELDRHPTLVAATVGLIDEVIAVARAANRAADRSGDT